MSHTIASAVSEALNIPMFSLINDRRMFRIIQHYTAWYERRNHSFQFAVDKAISDIAGSNGTDDRRVKELLTTAKN